MKIADISQHNHPIDWNIARKELELIIFRASIGTTGDKKYLEYAYNCRVPYGAYHYVKAGNAENARKEAKFFVEYANKASQKPLFYIGDIEYDAQNEETTEPVCVAFLEELRKLGCKKIGLYINTRYKWAGKAIDMCDIMWIPHWGKNDGNIPGNSAKPKHYNDLWQYTSNGSVKGIDDTVDLDLLNGDKPLSYFTEGWIKPDENQPTFTFLKKGSKGEEVKKLQKDLNSVLNLSLTEDGAFGSKTKEAVKQFQTEHNLDVNGEYDFPTFIALNKVLSQGSDTPAGGFITTKTVNVRAGDDTSYDKIGSLTKNTIINNVYNQSYQPIVSSNNWYAIYFENQIGWVSGNYIKENT